MFHYYYLLRGAPSHANTVPATHVFCNYDLPNGVSHNIERRESNEGNLPR